MNRNETRLLFFAWIAFSIFILIFWTLTKPIGNFWENVWFAMVLIMIVSSILLSMLNQSLKELNESEIKIKKYGKITIVLLFIFSTILAKPFDNIWYNIGIAIFFTIVIIRQPIHQVKKNK